MPATDNPFEAFFDLVPTGAVLYAPVLDAMGDVVDFTFERLNPAAQRLLSLPARPTSTFRAQYPHSVPTGIFAQYRTAYLTGKAMSYDVAYEGDGLHTFLRLVAQRSGEWLVVNFTDMADLPHTAVEEVLRTSQVHLQQLNQQLEAEQVEAERQRGELQRVFEQAPMAIAVYRGPAYIIELANPTVCRLWGRTQEQLIGKGLFEALPEVAGMGYEELLDGVMATGVPYVAHAMEAQHDRNGQRETVYWDFVYEPMYEADGRIYGAMVVATEVTEQVLDHRHVEQLNEELELRVTARSAEARAALYEAEQQREQARQQQALLSQILGQVPAAIATLSGPQHRFSFFNDGYQALVGGRAVLRKTVEEALPEVREQGFIALLDRVYMTGQPFSGTDTAVMLHNDTTNLAEQHYVDLVYQPLFDGQQRTQGILAFVVDVTEKVRARKQADTIQAAMMGVLKRQGQERENVFQLFEHAPVVICLLREPDHRIDYHNLAYQALFPGQELRGRTLAEVQPANLVLAKLLDGIYQDGQVQYQLGIPVYIPHLAEQPPRTRYFDFTYQAYREQDRIAGVSIFGFDVTERTLRREQVQTLNQELATINAQLERMNESLHNSNTQLKRTNADLDTFVYAASHDLKAPIANIEGLLGALRDYLPTHEQEPMVPRLVGMMEGAIMRFQQTVGHLTDVSRLQLVQTDEPEAGLDIAQVLEDVRLDLLPLLESAHAELLATVQACPSVRFSTKNLRSVLFNLLSNAVKYRAPDRVPQVQVRTRCTEQQLVLEVQDNGLGLTEGQQSQLFTMFRRLHNHVEGSGVGLYLIKRTIENAGGTLTVASEPGVGSTFTVTLLRA